MNAPPPYCELRALERTNPTVAFGDVDQLQNGFHGSVGTTQERENCREASAKQGLHVALGLGRDRTCRLDHAEARGDLTGRRPLRGPVAAPAGKEPSRV